MFGNVPSVDKTKKMWNDRNQSSFSFVEENSMHKRQNEAIKLQETIDNKIRNEYENKLVEIYNEKMKLQEEENVLKKEEYRQYLLKQIDDNKEKQKQTNLVVTKSQPATFSEELLDTFEKNNLKLSKQKEAKNALDECIKLKNDTILKNRQRDNEEEQKRTELLVKRENENLLVQEKAKQLAEQKECTKKGVAMLWESQKDDRDIEREKFINSLIEKERITNLDHRLRHESLLESQKKIELKKDLLKQIEEKVHSNLKDSDQGEAQTNIKTFQQGENVNVDESLQKSVSKTDQVDAGVPSNILKERNCICANNRFFGLSD